MGLRLTNCRKLLRCDYAWSDKLQQTAFRSATRISTGALNRSCWIGDEPFVKSTRELLQVVCEGNDGFKLARIVDEILHIAQTTIGSMLGDFLATIHRWLPVVDQEQLLYQLDPWPKANNAHLPLLVLAIFVVTRRPCVEASHSMNSQVYQTVRQLFAIQTSRETSLEMLQAGLLITYYAIGHGMPRDAHITLTTCVAIARLIGVDFDAEVDQPGLGRELSACRWAAVLLDRYAESSLTAPDLTAPQDDSDIECR